MPFKDRLYQTVASIKAKMLQYMLGSGYSGDVCFIPTMGALHDGHLFLIKRAIRDNTGGESKLIIVSIFVNPTQFGPNEDFLKYPRTLQEDLKIIFTDEEVKEFISSNELNDVVVFAPSIDEIYPFQDWGADFNDFSIQIPSLSRVLCGKSRPNHFSGVALVVTKLLLILQPNYIYLGAKDLQQTVIVRRLIEELFIDTQTVVVLTIRESDGLALSSRNRFLSPEERKMAPMLYQILFALQKMVGGIYPDIPYRVLDTKTLLEFGNDQLEILRKSATFDLRVDYLEIVSGETLQPVDTIDFDSDEKIFAALAVYFGSTRLIDNMELNVSGDF